MYNFRIAIKFATVVEKESGHFICRYSIAFARRNIQNLNRILSDACHNKGHRNSIAIHVERIKPTLFI